MERLARMVVRLIGVLILLSAFYANPTLFSVYMSVLLGVLGFILVMLS